MTAKVRKDLAQFIVAKKGVRTTLPIITSGTYSDHYTRTCNILYTVRSIELTRMHLQAS
jgi:hypothetical protein